MKASIIIATFMLGLPLTLSHASPKLEVVARSRSMIWNAAVTAGRNIYVSGPRWSGSVGPAVARLGKDGRPSPYPDRAWNNWRDGADAERSFVNVNALRVDKAGSLWVVDTGSPKFGGDPLPGGAKLVQIDLASDQVQRVLALGPDVAKPGSYVDDIRFNGDFAYLTDAGKPGLIVVNLKTGAMRRVLESHPATTARDDRLIIVDGATLLDPEGKPLRVNADPLEVSPDGQQLYFATLEGLWFQIATRWLDDFSASAADIAANVIPWADLPPVGGTVMDANGDLYFTELATSALKRRTPDGKITTILQDARLHWADAPSIDDHHRILLPVPQLDRAAIFHAGQSKIEWPVGLYRLVLPFGRTGSDARQ
jgi:sugar lactone lactonase YvrE